MPLSSSDSHLAYIGDQTIIDTKYEAARQAAAREGQELAAKPGECHSRTQPLYKTLRPAVVGTRPSGASFRSLRDNAVIAYLSECLFGTDFRQHLVKIALEFRLFGGLYLDEK
jgi:hypothetical protein